MIMKIKTKNKIIGLGISKEIGLNGFYLNNSMFFYLRFLKVYFCIWK